MNSKELAQLLNGREYGHEIFPAEEVQASEAGLVVIMGYSDDNIELYGALGRDELGAWGGTTARIHDRGLFYSECEEESCPYALREMEKCRKIKAIWCAPNSPAWTFETDIPHESFDIMDGGEVFCRGIVFSVEDIKC